MTRTVSNLFLVLLLLCSTAVGAQQDDVLELPLGDLLPESESKGANLVNNIFIDTDIRQAIQDVAAATQTVIVLEDKVEGIVTCELKDATLEKALEILLSGTSYTVTELGDYYLVSSVDPKSRSFHAISQTHFIHLNYIDASAAMKLLSPGFQEYVKAEGYSLCVTAPPHLAKRIIRDLQMFDAPPMHVLLDVRIVVLEQSDMMDLGIQWGWPTLSAGAFGDSDNKSSWPWGVRVGYTPGKEFTNSLMMTLNMLSQNGQASVVASPQVLAQHSKEAEIKVLTEEYFKIVTEGYYARSELEKIESGTILKITPHVSRDNTITLEMNAEVSDVIARGEDNLPVVTRRTAKSTVRIDDGGTAAIAGLMDNRTRLDKEETPGLSKLPLIGGLFKNKSDRKVSRQVAVFVTAQLMTDTGVLPSDAPIGNMAVVPEPAGVEYKEELKQSLAEFNRVNQ